MSGRAPAQLIALLATLLLFVVGTLLWNVASQPGRPATDSVVLPAEPRTPRGPRATPAELADTMPARTGSDRAQATPRSTVRPTPAAASGAGAGSDAPAGRVHLTGTAVAEGRPLPGAQILVVAKKRVLAEADTDARGRFSFVIPATDEAAALRILARGYVPEAIDLGSLSNAGARFLGNVHLRPGTVLAGSVVDGSGRPVSGAEVLLHGPGELAAGSRSDFPQRELTGADGSFHFTTAPSGPLLLTGRAPGFGERTVEHVHDGVRAAELRLEPERALEVRVHDPDGRPLAGAWVRIAALEARAPERESTSGDDGTCRFEGLGAARWSVYAERAGYRPASRIATAAETADIAIELAPWPCITGRVVTPEGRPAPPGTLVRSKARAGARTAADDASAEVDSEGRFRLCDQRPGKVFVVASSPAHAPTSSGTLEIGAVGDVDAGTIVLVPGGTIALEVATEGSPLEHVRVSAYHERPTSHELWYPRSGGRSDADSVTDWSGGAVLGPLAAGRYWVRTETPEHVPLVAGPFRVEAGAVVSAGTLELQSGARLSGRVFDASGRALTGARVSIVGAPELDVLPLTFVSGLEGDWRTPPLPPGRYTVRATSSSFSARETASTPEEIVLERGEQRTLDVKL